MYVIGINHKKADTKTREQFVLSEKEQTEFFNRLKKEMPGAGCVMLMTCNRSELYLSGGELTFSKIEQLFMEVKQLPASLVKAVLLRYEGEAAIHHLFHVVCGLESAVLGEVEIIRQVKEAYQSSVGQQMVDASLHLIFQHALKLAKEMATNSRMTHLPVSVGTLATLAVSDFVKEKQEPHVLLLGATGQMGSMQRAVAKIKEWAPDLIVIADVCLCEYTSHGHCGVVKEGRILNDETLPLLAKMAVSLAKAGADMIAPSDMMDGHTAYLRKSLDEHGFIDTLIMGYSAKFASGYYSPFRDAAQSAPAFGDRRTYQMDPANRREAIRECDADVLEGADILMVKPALAYLDIVRQVRDRYDHPLAVYNVSGEYSMVKAAAQNGWIDEKRIVMENMIAMKRAGADIIITYHALDVAAWLKEERETV